MKTLNIADVSESFGLNSDGVLAGTGVAVNRQRAVASRGAKIVEAAKLLEQAWGGNRIAGALVEEALSTSDLFKSATGDVLDREMLAQYEAMPPQWSKFSSRTSVRNFKPKQLRDLSGARNRLELVPELTEYPSADYAISERSIAVKKYGRRFGYSFEAKINDELDELAQVPGEFANAARLTEDYLSLQLMVNPLTGAPNTTFFNVGNGNLGTGLLNQDNLQAAVTTVSTKRDSDGNLLTPGPLQLIVGPALSFIAQRLINQTEVRVTTGDTTTVEPNPLRGRVTLTVLENLPGTAWFVLPLPTAPRPAFYTAFLRGWESPVIRYKADQGARAGGGQVGVDDGSFDVDGVYWRVRHIVGAAHGDPKFTYASDGLG